eukprot:tig00020801_g13891.t1
MAMAEGQSAAPILSLSDDLMMLLMKTAAEVNGTLDVLRGLASARRRFQELAYGESSTLFEEPVFVRQDRDAGRGDTILDVARLSARFGDRIQRLWLKNVDFDVVTSAVASADSGDPGPQSHAWGTDPDAPPPRPQTAASRALSNVLCSCPNLTHLSLAGNWCQRRRDAAMGALECLPPGFSLPRLRHLDLSYLDVSLELFTLLRLLQSCSGTLERLFLRGTRVDLSYAGFQRLSIAYPELGKIILRNEEHRNRHRMPFSLILEHITFPRLESLDIELPLARALMPDELQRLVARLPALRELYVSGASARRRDREMPERDGGYAVRPGVLIVDDELHEMDAASLRALKRHFEGRFDRYMCPDCAAPEALDTLAGLLKEGRALDDVSHSPPERDGDRKCKPRHDERRKAIADAREADRRQREEQRRQAQSGATKQRLEERQRRAEAQREQAAEAAATSQEVLAAMGEAPALGPTPTWRRPPGARREPRDEPRAGPRSRPGAGRGASLGGGGANRGGAQTGPPQAGRPQSTGPSKRPRNA